MSKWLAKILPSSSGQSGRNLPVRARSGPPSAPKPRNPQDKLPNASVVYGMAASALFVVAVYFLFTGMWFTGMLVLLPAACFLGFALHFLRHS